MALRRIVIDGATIPVSLDAGGGAADDGPQAGDARLDHGVPCRPPRNCHALNPIASSMHSAPATATAYMP